MEIADEFSGPRRGTKSDDRGGRGRTPLYLGPVGDRQERREAAAEQVAGHRRAIEALSKIETFHAPIPAVYLWIADSWEVVGDKKAAAESRARADALQPTTAADYFLLGEHHAQHGRLDEAVASYWQALGQQPDHFLSLLAAGVALGELQRHELAEAMLTGAIALNPQTVLAYAKRAAGPAGARQDRFGHGRLRRKAKNLDPELARVIMRRARGYRSNLDFDKALADCNEAIRLDPKCALAYAERALSTC